MKENIKEQLSKQELYSTEELLEFLSPLTDYYPNFNEWFLNKVIPELGTRREIKVRKLDGELSAVAILRKAEPEKGLDNKICTFFVGESFRREGIGRELMANCLNWFDWYNQSDVVISVTKSCNPCFEGFLSRFGFKLEDKTDKDEFIYRLVRREIKD